MVSSLYFTLEVHAHVSFVVKVGAVNVLFTVDPVLSFVRSQPVPETHRDVYRSKGPLITQAVATCAHEVRTIT